MSKYTFVSVPSDQTLPATVDLQMKDGTLYAQIEPEKTPVPIEVSWRSEHVLNIEVQGKKHRACIAEQNGVFFISIGREKFQFQSVKPQSVSDPSISHQDQNTDGRIETPMPGKIIKLLVGLGDQVKRGQAVAILESMKMESEVTAFCEGNVRHIYVQAGDQVAYGTILMKIEP